MWTIQRKKNKAPEIVLEKDPMADILGKDFKNNCLSYAERTKRMCGKVKKMMYEQKEKYQ